MSKDAWLDTVRGLRDEGFTMLVDLTAVDYLTNGTRVLPDDVEPERFEVVASLLDMDDTTCAVKAAHNLVRFFAHESCGKCTPCREGTSWLEKILRRIETGQGREEDLDLLLDVSDNISPGIAWPPKQTTICPLGPSAVAPIASSIQRFRDEYLLHIKEGGCPSGRH